MAYTINQLCLEARGLLSDTVAAGPVTRYADQDLINAFNGALVRARMKRPDLFLDMGLRNAVPQYATADLGANTPFPIDYSAYSAFLYYIVGLCELREDTFSDDKRAELLLAKFTNELMQVSS